MKAETNTNDPIVFSQPGNTVAHIERRSTGALILVIPMTLPEAITISEAANAGLQHIENPNNADLRWVMERIGMQWRMAVAEKAEARQ